MTNDGPATPDKDTAHGPHERATGDTVPGQVQTAPQATPTPKMTFREVMTAGGPMTLGVFVGLQLLDSIDGTMFSVFAPDIRTSLGVTSAEIAIVAALSGVMVSLAALPLGVLGDRRRRTTIAGVCTLLWALAAGAVGLVHHLWQAVIARVLVGIGKANEGPIQTSILVDAYPPAGRGRVLGLHRSAQPLGIVVGPLLAALFALVIAEEHEPWRWAFAFLVVPGLILGLAALRLREPERGRLDRQALLGDETLPTPNTRPVSLPAAFARLKKIRTFYFVMVALGAFGLAVITVPTYLSIILEDQLGQGAAARGMIAAVAAVGGLAGATLGGAYSDRLFRRNPTASLYLASAALAALGIGFAIQAYSPNVATFIIIGMLTQAMLFAGLVPLSLIVASVTPPEIRATAFAMVSLFLAVVGGLGGALLTALADSLWGTQAAVAVVAPAATVLAGLILSGGARHLPRDIAQIAAGVLKKQEVDRSVRSGGGGGVR